MQDAIQVRTGLVLEVDPDSGTITQADEMLETALGFAPGSLVGLHVSTLARPRPEDPASGDPVAELFSDATHDLVAPLNQVSALATLLVRKHKAVLAEPGAQEIVDHIQSAVRRMGDLADALKLLSKVLGCAAVVQTVDTNGLLAAALANCDRKVQAAGAEITYGHLPQVEGDASQLIYVFEELLENAIKFRGDEVARIDIRAFERGGYNVFAVRDNGMGFEPAAAAQVFRMFRRLNPSEFPGNGVGLAICRQILHRHSGQIWAESEPGKGTTVFFALPKPAGARSTEGESGLA